PPSTLKCERGLIFISPLLACTCLSHPRLLSSNQLKSRSRNCPPPRRYRIRHREMSPSQSSLFHEPRSPGLTNRLSLPYPIFSEVRVQKKLELTLKLQCDPNGIRTMNGVGKQFL